MERTRLVRNGLLPRLLDQLHELCLLLDVDLVHLGGLGSHLVLNWVGLRGAAQVAVRRIGRILSWDEAVLGPHDFLSALVFGFHCGGCLVLGEA